MERIKQSHTEEFRPVRLYLDDIERIYEILSEFCDNLEIRTQKYVLKEPQLLLELDEKLIHYLRIRTSWRTDHQVDLQLQKWRSCIEIDEDDTIMRGAVERVREVVEPHQRRWLGLIDRIGPYTLGALAALTVLARSMHSANINSDLWQWMYFVSLGFSIAMLLLLGVWYFPQKYTKHSTIVLRYRDDVPGFFKRNIDQIITGIIIAVITVALTLLTQVLTGWSP